MSKCLHVCFETLEEAMVQNAPWLQIVILAYSIPYGRVLSTHES